MFLSRSSSAMSVGSESSDTLMSPRTFRPSSSQGMREDNSDKHLGKGCKQEDFDEVNISLMPFEKLFKLHKIEDPRPKLGHSDRMVFNCLAICKLCEGYGMKKTYIKFQSDSKGNLRTHLKGKMHRGHKTAQLLDEFDDIKKATSKKGHRLNVREKDTSRQLSFRQAQEMSRHFTQDKGRQAWVKWFTTLCIAPSISAHPATREMMKVFRPEFNLPSHTAMKNTIDDQARKAKKELMSILKEARYVATTADSWSAHHRAFLGCTVHWIDAETLRRKHGTLACKELKSNQTKELLANEIYKINSEFGITRKIVATTTDNGANYCAAFAHFGDNQDDPLAVAPEHEDPDGGDVAIVSVHDLLEEEVEDEAEDLPKLPTQRRCAAHTLNLLATTDVSKVVGWNYGTGRQARQPFTKAAAKAQGLWNLHNRSSVVANKIRDVVGRKLNTPCPTRWNTLYDATECLLKTALKDPETIEAINEVMKSEAAGKRAAAPVFTEEDKEILQEYCKVMKPVAICLDRLQAEVNAYMGILLPYLMLLKRDLQAIKREGELRYADPLVDALLEQDGTVHGFNNRFMHLFADEDLLMATLTHPNHGPFMLKHVAPALEEDIKERLIREIVTSITPDPLPSSQSQDMVTEKPKEASDDPFAFLESPTVMEEDGSNIGELIKKEVDTWGRSKVAEVKPGQFPSMHREKWISLFIKYNTALPSSAAVERMFSTAGDVLRPKRASMTSDRFEKLVFTKGNMQLLDAVLRRERREGECDSERETDVE
ncbi:hypothetical protein GWK47_045672 [Chionoecetes opilio]|uniref:HAT C-terminal dimerisation domain-containing protein n=1 Tax=Chionoecetes opilio TaxID=41210 RepID=A0A8J5CV39_CHIOP|nr:hypothetical protein GWK47_045672 [Chionoecetes opilio]